MILVSGGLDSFTVVGIAKNLGYEVYPLSFYYHQKHDIELEKARKSLELFGLSNHKIINIDLSSFGASALTDVNIDVPKYKNHNEIGDTIPITYVPARNIIFLSIALAYAESINAYDVFLGIHSQDSANYPDCTKDFLSRYEEMANKGLGFTQNNRKLRIQAPLINMNKAEIIAKGLELGLDYSNTISCYDATHDGISCGSCHACLVRLDGFRANNIEDPVKYR